MSSEFKKLRGLVALSVVFSPADVAPSGDEFWISKGTPSITYSGIVLDRIEFAPLICTWTPAPGSPLLEVICTPAILPCISCSGEDPIPTLKSSALSEAMDPVRSLFLATPYPITTTSSSCIKSSSRVTLMVETPDTDCSLLVQPT